MSVTIGFLITLPRSSPDVIINKKWPVKPGTTPWLPLADSGVQGHACILQDTLQQWPLSAITGNCFRRQSSYTIVKRLHIALL